MPQNTLNLLGTSTSDGGCCGGGGTCMCGNGGAETAAPLDRDATPAPSGIGNAGERGSGIANGSAPGGLAVEYLVEGMTCGHCVAAVKSEVGAIEGVDAVEVVLKNGGASRVTVRSSASVSPAAVRDAVAEAGYTLL